jgi:glutaredoxin
MFNINKKRSLVWLLSTFFLLSASFVSAQEKLEINFFYGESCPHCAATKTFLLEIQEDYPEIEIKEYVFSKNIDLVKEFYLEYEVSQQEQGFVPLVFINERYFVGYSERINEEIKSLIQEFFGEEATTENGSTKIPFLGEIDDKNISLPVLAVVLGILDGFNVCSLGALVLILGLVLTLKSKKKILAFGGIFLLVTVLVYGILVFFWHQLFSILAPFLKRIEIVVGIFALVGAVYFSKEFIKNLKGRAVCQFGGISEGLSQKVQTVFDKKSSIFALIGAIALFAAAVTIIEFPCTAFFPVLFAGILTETATPLSLALLYIVIYILFYVLDELIVLLIAAFTMKIWVASPKFTIVLNFFAAILLILFSVYYLFDLF